jgi:hypothetical protein
MMTRHSYGLAAFPALPGRVTVPESTAQRSGSSLERLPDDTPKTD